MTIDIDAIKSVALAAGKAGAPFIEEALTAALSGMAGPFGLLVSPALNVFFPMINTALGLDPATPPDQTAAAIEADPEAAKDKLSTLAEDHQFQLAAGKQVQDFALASQAQQVAIDTVEVQNPSLFVGGPRPAILWGFGAIAVANFALPIPVWILQNMGHTLTAPPKIDDVMMYALMSLLGVSLALRSADKALGTASPQIGGTSRVAVKRK